MKALIFILCIGILACNDDTKFNSSKIAGDTTRNTAFSPVQDAEVQGNSSTGDINTGTTTPDELMTFAETQVGVPYVYASCDPKVGFDCSGFITYVFNHFHIAVPRSSYGFTHMGKTVPFNAAKRGDIILFTGTDSLATDIGHIGLVVSNNNGVLNFIHSTSGKAMAVTVTAFDEHYKKRFVRISRVFPQNG